MSTETWDEVGPKLSSAFTTGACEAAYREELISQKPALSSAIDDYVRANGIGDELLDAVAPAATGDLVAVFTIAGRVASGGSDGGTSGMPMSAPGMSASARNPRYRGVPAMSGGPTRTFGGSASGLEMSASFFSPGLHRSVGLVEMRYFGSSLEDALGQLAAKVRSSLPGSACAAWNWSVHVDDQRIRELIEH
jgi:hypothetical protein